jgi:hypothetical protein
MSLALQTLIKSNGLGALLELLVDALADRIADRIAARDESLIDQNDARGLLGRRHIDAVKRRRAEKRGDAWVRGRDYLMTPAAVREELERLSTFAHADSDAAPAVTPAPKRSKAASRSSELANLKREIEADMRAASRRS